MKGWFGSVVLFGLLLGTPSPIQPQVECKAWIVVEPDDDFSLRIQAFCKSPKEGALQYRLKARKTGRSGNSLTFQSGSARVRRGEETLLSQIRLRVLPQDRYAIQLEVYQEGKKVAEDRIIYPSELKM